MWQNLIETLGKLGDVYDSLVTLGEKKRVALVDIDIKRLADLLDAEQLLMAKIQRLEQQRVEILKDLSKSDKMLNEATAAKDFYRAAPSLAIEKQLLQAHKRLSKNVDKALTVRNDNQFLAQCALDAVQGQLNRLSGASVEPTYSGKGADVVTHRKNFDFKA